MATTTISRTVTIKASKDKVCAALSDIGNVYKMSPNLTSSHSTSDQVACLGATRHCDFAMMGAEVEEHARLKPRLKPIEAG